MTAGKGDTQRPFDAEKFNAHFEQIFGVKCKDCGKNTKPGDVHTCSPQFGKSSIDTPEYKAAQQEFNARARALLGESK